jgi:hypothetical protein
LEEVLVRFIRSKFKMEIHFSLGFDLGILRSYSIWILDPLTGGMVEYVQ